MTDPADRVAAKLAEVRDRANAPANAALAQLAKPGRDADAVWRLIGESAADVPVLLAVADAALAHHQPKTVSYTTPCATHWRLPHLLADRAEADACPDCLTVKRQVCRSCRHECPDDDTWPCDEYRDISSALLGKEATDAG